jgi:polyhydroxybutyrate depolymerase
MSGARKLLLVLVSIAVLVAAGGCARRSPAPPASTSSPQTSLPTGASNRSLTHNGRIRTYIVYVPASVDAAKPVPLVFVLHGGTGNAESAVGTSGFDGVADKNGFVAVYPDGTGRLSSTELLTWNGGDCCGYAQEQNIDDVGFLRAVVTDLQAHLNVDANRIYATGMSNGGILAQRLGCQAADVFAAIAPVSGTLNYQPCNPSRPVSVIEFHGTADTHIPYAGGYGPDSLVNVDFASVSASVGFWASFDGCGATAATNSFADISHQVWTGCGGGTSLELYTVEGGGHAWPGGQGGWADSDTPTQSINASALIWAFFAAHPKG